MAHILLAEDDTSMRQFITTALENAGHRVTARNAGLTALEALESNQDFDLLLSDIVMPGLDGVELARTATKKYPGLKVMFISGFAAMSAGGEKQEHTNAQILSKPFHLNDLVAQVEKLLRGEE